MGHNTIAGLLLVIPHQHRSMDGVRQDLREGLVEEGVMLRPSSDIRVFSDDTVAADYSGTLQGAPARGYGLGVLSPFGGGAYVSAISTVDGFRPELAAAAESAARALRFVKPEAGGDSDVRAHFVGLWQSWGRNTDRKVELRADGSYFDNSVYSFSSSDAYSDLSYASQNQAAGRWSVRGTKEQGVITLIHNEGGQDQIPYRVHRENGRVYWREYYFGDQLFQKQ